MLFSVFGETTVTLKMLIFASTNILIVFFFSDSTAIQNNYVVHLLTICYQPIITTIMLKYKIF